MLFSLSPPPLFGPVAPSKRRFSPFDSHWPFFKTIHPDTCIANPPDNGCGFCFRHSSRIDPAASGSLKAARSSFGTGELSPDIGQEIADA